MSKPELSKFTTLLFWLPENEAVDDYEDGQSYC